MDVVLISGLLSTILTEVCKRIPQIPLDPTHQNTVKTVVVTLNAIAIVAGHYATGTLTQVPWSTLGLEVIVGAIVSFTSYHIIPFMKKEVAKTA
jgi:hypothetical protein